MSPKQWLLDTGERVGTTFIEVFLGVVIVSWLANRPSVGVGTPLVDVSLVGMAAAAALAAAANVMLNAITGFNRLYQSWWQDLIFRVAKASLLAALVVITAVTFNVWSVTGWETAGIAAITAAATVLKGFIAKYIPVDTITPASLLPVSEFVQPEAIPLPAAEPFDPPPPPVVL